ncbi:hypothetical protein ZIOFF_047369 [Zingiber officinale]|uniref:Pentatricopeptide repeat-containing protein n=1 Tax=Zingiber officinale TaxID=94328 RepID=A0A8J5KJU9_ZINOF|nr:hypothetical protein ZIOFF_047369 [Zingiber officinale]
MAERRCPLGRNRGKGIVVSRAAYSLGSGYVDPEEDEAGIGQEAKRRLLELEPRRVGNYVMAANMYSDQGSWDEAAKVRRRMREEGHGGPDLRRRVIWRSDLDWRLWFALWGRRKAGGLPARLEQRKQDPPQPPLKRIG